MTLQCPVTSHRRSLSASSGTSSRKVSARPAGTQWAHIPPRLRTAQMSWGRGSPCRGHSETSSLGKLCNRDSCASYGRCFLRTFSSFCVLDVTHRPAPDIPLSSQSYCLVPVLALTSCAMCWIEAYFIVWSLLSFLINPGFLIMCNKSIHATFQSVCPVILHL